jgi:hypothetical protein
MPKLNSNRLLATIALISGVKLTTAAKSLPAEALGWLFIWIAVVIIWEDKN